METLIFPTASVGSREFELQLAALLEQLKDRLRRCIIRKTGLTPTQIDDVLQEIFLKLARKWPKLATDCTEQLVRQIFVLAKRTALDFQNSPTRGTARTKSLDGLVTNWEPSARPEQRSVQHDERAVVRAELARLQRNHQISPRDWVVFYLHRLKPRPHVDPCSDRKQYGMSACEVFHTLNTDPCFSKLPKLTSLSRVFQISNRIRDLLRESRGRLMHRSGSGSRTLALVLHSYVNSRFRQANGE